MPISDIILWHLDPCQTHLEHSRFIGEQSTHMDVVEESQQIGAYHWRLSPELVEMLPPELVEMLHPTKKRSAAASDQKLLMSDFDQNC